MFSLVDILRNSRCHPSRCILAVLALCLGKSLFFAKFVKCSAIFCYPTKTTQPRPRVSQFPFLNFLVISRYSFDIIFQISQQKVFQICPTVVDDHWRISCGIWPNLISSIEHFHSHDQHLCNFIKTEESVYIRNQLPQD